MDNKALLALWKLEEMPACEEGMRLAQAFLISCGEGVNRLGTEEPSDRITDLTACYMALVEHGEDDHCCIAGSGLVLLHSLERLREKPMVKR